MVGDVRNSQSLDLTLDGLICCHLNVACEKKKRDKGGFEIFGLSNCKNGAVCH